MKEARPRSVVIFASLVFAALMSFSAFAQTPLPETADPALSETSDLWFVELSSPPLADGGKAITLKSEKSAFRSAAKKAGINYTERYAFDTLFNGLSLKADESQVPALARISGVKAVWPVERIDVPDVAVPADPELFTSLELIGADVVHSELEYTGAGVKVGVIDTGIDYHNPDLGNGCFGAGCRVVTGWDFVGDAYTGNNSPVPDSNPDDCAGHGSHVSGIIGANGGIEGVAPGVTFGAYRVFGCTGSTSGDIMIAAMERALADGMQVINMSIGSSYQWPNYPTAMAATRLVNKGVVVACSFGNSGDTGLWSGSAPGVGDKVIASASFENKVSLPAFSITSDGMRFQYNTAPAAPPPPAAGTYPMARTGTTSSAADACSALTPGSLTGKVALIRRGTCTFTTKVTNAKNAGAVAVVLYNNQTGGMIPSLSPAATIPVVAILQNEGAIIDSRLASGSVDMTWMGNTWFAGAISNFSSYGLSPSLDLKPDLGAPGGHITSTYVSESGYDYATMSGTSMASPHTAGSAALLLQAHPNTPAQAVRTILQNTADPKFWWANSDSELYDNVHRQGAGMLRIDHAILTTTRVEPSSLSLGESEAGPVARTLRISNNSSADVTYNLLYVDALATGPNTFLQTFPQNNSTVIFSAPSVTVPAHGSRSFDVTISPDPSLADRSIYGGYIGVVREDLTDYSVVPFAGMKGDYQSIPVLTSGGYGFPWLARFVSPSYVQQTAGSTFTLASGDYPYFLVHFEQSPRLFRMEVSDANTGKNWHRYYQWDYAGRSSGPTSYYAIPFDGWDYIAAKNGSKWFQVPNGQYIMKISVLKALGDASNPDHWETWTSPMFNIARP